MLTTRARTRIWSCVHQPLLTYACGRRACRILRKPVELSSEGEAAVRSVESQAGLGVFGGGCVDTASYPARVVCGAMRGPTLRFGGRSDYLRLW